MHEIEAIILLIRQNIKFFGIKDREDKDICLIAHQITLSMALYASLGIFTYPMTEQQFRAYWQTTGIKIPPTHLGKAFQKELIASLNILLKTLNNPWKDNSSYYLFLFKECRLLNSSQPALPIFSYQNVSLPDLIQGSSLYSNNSQDTSIKDRIQNASDRFIQTMIKKVLLRIYFIFSLFSPILVFVGGAVGIVLLALALNPILPTFTLFLAIAMIVGLLGLSFAAGKLLAGSTDRIDYNLSSPQSIPSSLFNIISNALHFCLNLIFKPLDIINKVLNWINSYRYCQKLKSIHTWSAITEIEDSRDNTYDYAIKELNADNDSILSVNLECRDDEKGKEKIIENDNEQEKNLDPEETFYGEDEEAVPLTVFENFVGGSSSPSSQ